MDINQINDGVFKYIVEIIKDDVEGGIDIYHIKDYQYRRYVLEFILNVCNLQSCLKSKYFGNQTRFNPSALTLIEMLKYIMEYRMIYLDGGMELLFRETEIDTYYDILIEYGHYYVKNFGYEGFLSKLKDYVDADE